MAAGDRKRVLVKLGDFDVSVRVKSGTTYTTVKKNKPVFTKMVTSAATALASDKSEFPVTLKGNTDDAVVAKGTKGAGSIKISLGETTASGAEKLYSVPVPANFTILDCYSCIKNIVGSAKLASVKSFVSKHGVTYPYNSTQTISDSDSIDGDEVTLQKP